jgi:hypothetical protein
MHRALVEHRFAEKLDFEDLLAIPSDELHLDTYHVPIPKGMSTICHISFSIVQHIFYSHLPE